MTVLNEEIRTLRTTIATYNKQLQETTDQTEKAILKEKIELAEQILEDKLSHLNDY